MSPPRPRSVASKNEKLLSSDQVTESVEELAYLIQEKRFTEKQLRIAGLSGETIGKWLKGLRLLADD